MAWRDVCYVTVKIGHEYSVMKIPAAEFKARCLKLMDEVAQTRKPVVITKRGKAVAQLIARASGIRHSVRLHEGNRSVQGGVIAPLDEEWSVHSGDEDYLYRNPRAQPNSGARRRPAARKGKTK